MISAALKSNPPIAAENRPRGAGYRYTFGGEADEPHCTAYAVNPSYQGTFQSHMTMRRPEASVNVPERIITKSIACPIPNSPNVNIQTAPLRYLPAYIR